MIRGIVVENGIDYDSDYECSYYSHKNGRLTLKEVMEFASEDEFERVAYALRNYGPKEDGWPQYKLLKLIETTDADMKEIIDKACAKYDKQKRAAEARKKKAAAERKKKAEEKKKKDAMKKAMEKLTPEELEKLMENVK